MDAVNMRAPAAVPAHGHGAQASAQPALPRIGIDALMRRCRRFVIVAPHPDDETLGAGGMLSALVRAGCPVAVIAVTDGESSHAPGSWWTPERLRSTRPAESARALFRLGWQRPVVHRLQIPDGAVAAHEDSLARQLTTLLCADDRVLTTWLHDGHPDHEATARAVAIAAAQVGCAVAQFPIWNRWRVVAARNARVEGDYVRRFALDADAVRRKRAALQAYRSQLLDDPLSGAPPVVPATMVGQFLQPFEVVVL